LLFRRVRRAEYFLTRQGSFENIVPFAAPAIGSSSASSPGPQLQPMRAEPPSTNALINGRFSGSPKRLTARGPSAEQLQSMVVCCVACVHSQRNTWLDAPSPAETGAGQAGTHGVGTAGMGCRCASWVHCSGSGAGGCRAPGLSVVVATGGAAMVRASPGGCCAGLERRVLAPCLLH
jgi:hypothetical protein